MKILALLWIILGGILCGCSPLRVVERVSDEVLRYSQINHSLELVAVDGQSIDEVTNRPFIISSQKNTQAVTSRHTFIGALYPLVQSNEYTECLIPFADALIYSEQNDESDDAVSLTAADDNGDSPTVDGNIAGRTSLNFRNVTAVVGEEILLHPQYGNELTEIIGFIQQLENQPQYYRLGAVRVFPDGTISAPLFVANDTSYTIARIVCAIHDKQWHVSGFAINIYDLAENFFDTTPKFSPHTNRNNRSGLLQ